jgi:hypothetical protein
MEKCKKFLRSTFPKWKSTKSFRGALFQNGKVQKVSAEHFSKMEKHKKFLQRTFPKWKSAKNLSRALFHRETAQESPFRDEILVDTPSLHVIFLS